MTERPRGPVAGSEALEAALRQAVARGQAIADAHHLARLATRLAAETARPVGSGAPPVASARRFRVTEMTVSFEAEMRRDASAADGWRFVAAMPAQPTRRRRTWPRRLFDALRGRRIAPVTLTIRPDAAETEATP